MKKRFMSIVFVLLIISASLLLLFNRSGSGSNIVPPDVTWSNVLGDSNFADGSCWMVDTWNQGTSTHNYSLGDGTAYTFLEINGFNKWGNTEFEQGVDPWGAYGQPLPSVDLTVPQRLVANCCVVESSGNPVCGRVNLYVEFWLHHPDGDGVKGYRWAEAMIVFDSEGLLMPCNAGENSYWAKYPVEGDWYFVGYRHQNMGDGWAYRETDLNSVFGLLESEFGCSLDEWVVSCVCFGVEGTSGSLAAEWGLVQWDVEA